MPHLFNYSSVPGYLTDGFYLVAITNNAMNNPTEFCVNTGFQSLGYIQRSMTAGPYGI